MSKAWEALSEYDRDYLLDYVAGHHADELGIVQAIGEAHADPEVRAAAEDARRALKRAAAFVARRYEGDIGRELEKRRGEFAVGLLVRLLALVTPEPVARNENPLYAMVMRDRARPCAGCGCKIEGGYTTNGFESWCSACRPVGVAGMCKDCGGRGDSHAADCSVRSAPIGLDGSVARFPRPPHDDVYLGHTDEYADAYARNDLLVLFGGEPDEDPRERTYVPRHDIIGSRVARGSALYHQHLATLAPQVPR
jgi:hypothetical protein